MNDYPEGFCLTEDEGFSMDGFVPVDMSAGLEKDNVKRERTGRGILTMIEGSSS